MQPLIYKLHGPYISRQFYFNLMEQYYHLHVNCACNSIIKNGGFEYKRLKAELGVFFELVTVFWQAFASRKLQYGVSFPVIREILCYHYHGKN